MLNKMITTSTLLFVVVLVCSSFSSKKGSLVSGFMTTTSLAPHPPLFGGVARVPTTTTARGRSSIGISLQFKANKEEPEVDDSDKSSLDKTMLAAWARFSTTEGAEPSATTTGTTTLNQDIIKEETPEQDSIVAAYTSFSRPAAATPSTTKAATTLNQDDDIENQEEAAGNPRFVSAVWKRLFSRTPPSTTKATTLNQQDTQKEEGPEQDRIFAAYTRVSQPPAGAGAASTVTTTLHQTSTAKKEQEKEPAVDSTIAAAYMALSKPEDTIIAGYRPSSPSMARIKSSFEATPKEDLFGDMEEAWQ